MSSFKMGYDGVLYLSTAVLDGRPGDSPTPTNTYNDATWNELDNVMDVDGNFDSEKVDTTTRSEAKKGWASEVSTTKSGSMTFTMRWKPSDARFTQLKNAWLNGTEVGVLDLDGAKTVAGDGSQGLVANMSVSFSQKKPVKGIMTVDVTLTVASYPDWVYVQSDGTLALTDD